MESPTAQNAPASASSFFSKHTLLFRIGGLLLVVLIGAAFYFTRGNPAQFIEAVLSATALPKELQGGVFIGDGGILYRLEGAGFRSIAPYMWQADVSGPHIASVHRNKLNSALYVDRLLIATSTDFLADPALSSDGTKVAWTQVVAPRSSKFSDQIVRVRTLGTNTVKAYRGMVPFFTPAGELGLFVEDGIRLTNLDDDSVRLIPTPSGVAFSSAAMQPPTLSVSPDATYIAWMDTDGTLTVMRLTKDGLEPVLTRTAVSQNFALGNDALYSIVRENGKSFVERISFSDGATSRTSLPSSLKIISIAL